MALQLLALVTVNWLFFSKAIKMFYSPVCAGHSARVHTCDETELPMPLEHSRTQHGVIFLPVCFRMPPCISTNGTKTMGRGLLVSSPDLITVPLDVLRFLFMF